MWLAFSARLHNAHLPDAGPWREVISSLNGRRSRASCQVNFLILSGSLAAQIPLKWATEAPWDNLLYIDPTVYIPEGSSLQEILSRPVLRVVSSKICWICLHSTKASWLKVLRNLIPISKLQASTTEIRGRSQMLNRVRNRSLRGLGPDQISNQNCVLCPSSPSRTWCFAPNLKKCLILCKDF
jgi:hypothetical protein